MIEEMLQAAMNKCIR